MAKTDLDAPELYLNRELSWLEFNDRVLREGIARSVPLLERLKFLAIVSSNLDEFFMIRVAGLRQRVAAGDRQPDFGGMTPQQQLDAIRARVQQMVAEQAAAIGEVVAELADHGLRFLDVDRLSPEQQRFVKSYFTTNVLPVLTPLALEELSPRPLLPGLTLYLALVLQRQGDADEPAERFVVVPVPGTLPRFITVPGEQGVSLVRLEDVMLSHLGVLFSGYRIQGRTLFRITRDADVAVEQEEDGLELIHAMEEAVRQRRRRGVVRLSILAGTEPRLTAWLMEQFRVGKQDVYEVAGMLDAAALMGVALRPGFDDLKYPEWPPQRPRDLLGRSDLWEVLQERDVLLFHPYESFDPVVQLVQSAAEDPNVLAIKQTLYRTSGNSPIVKALVRAAQSGKQVTVLVELKARFDEEKNVHWARELEDAGCFVIYGIAGYKTHAKALLVVRRESHRITRYAHLATGNYNDRTARLYSDVGLMTSDADLTADLAAFFNLLTGYSQPVGWKKLEIAPTGIRPRILDLIQREIQASTPDQPGLIMAKVNSLQDRRIIRALYRASREGVRVLLNVRGICCLRPGVPGVSDNIDVVSVVDRYLEHARIFYFRNGGHEEVFCSSADWMIRNLDKRLELLFPIQQPDLERRLIQVLNTFFADNVKARRLLPDGRYVPVPAHGQAVRAQEQFYHESVEAALADRQAIVEFRPLGRPEE